MQKTESGEADAFIGIDISPAEGFHVVATFAGRPFFFAGPKGDRTIIDEIDQTIERINESNPQLQDSLYKKHFANNGSGFALTSDEIEFARNHKTLRVGIVSERAPLQSFDDLTGELEGVSRRMLDYLSQKTGLSLSAPYMTTNLLLVYNRFVDPDDLSNQKLALSWDLESAVPASDAPIIYESMEECFKAVNDGRADYTYGTSYTTPYYTNTEGLNNLLTLPTSTEAIEICFGLVHPVEPDLLFIINKSICGLSAEELNSIVYENVLVDSEEQVGAFFASHLLEFATAAIAVLMVVIVLLVLYLRSRVLASRRVREENLRFQKLYSLTNELLFEYSLASDTLTMSNPQGSRLQAFDGLGEKSDDGSYRIVPHAHAFIAANADPEILDALTSPTSSSVDLPYEPKSGEKHWIRIASHLVTNDEGRPLSVIGKITSVDGEVREKMDLSERAQRDGLTGLLNWVTFRERAEKLLGEGSCGAMLVIDTDDFKSVNDTYGHLAGDVALRETAEELRGAFRPHDLIGRLGGDEFAVCISGPINHDKLAERCAHLVSHGVTFDDQTGVERTITLSIGGVELAGIAVPYHNAYQQADSALYRAKAEGKDRYVLEKMKG